MRKVQELKASQVYKVCDLGQLNIQTTEDLPPCADFIGQKRAVESIEFGIGMDYAEYNIFLVGPTGVGKSTTIETILARVAKSKPTPGDWCYVYNFQDPNEPKAIALPTGKGKVFHKDMEDFLQILKTDIPRAFESKEFEEQKQNLMNESQRKKNTLFEELQKTAAQNDIQIQFSPTGIITIPLLEGKPVSQEQYNALSEEVKNEIMNKKETVDNEVAEALKAARKIENEAVERLRELERRVALFAVRGLIENLSEKYHSFPRIIDYLDQVQKHILENIDNFLPDKNMQAAAGMPFPFRMPAQQPPTFTEYKVNVFIDNSLSEGAPVIFETHPTYSNLFGSIEKEARFGALFTDFTMIRPGSLAKANGGYVVLEVLDMFKFPFVWDSLKKAIENQELRIEDIYQQFGYSSTIGLRPEPIKLDVKVIIAGNSYLYQMLYAYDEDFRKLFKVKADFDTVVDRNDDTLSQYSCFIKSICERDGLNPFDRSGLETVIEYSSRLSGDQSKLSVQLGSITKVLKEADYWAKYDGGSGTTKREHVEKAIEEKIYRSNMVEEKIQEMIAKGTLLVDTEGMVTGQINGLAVYNMGDYAFGKPSRITCETFMGTEGVVNIERKSRMSGNIHDKGVLILSGYIGARYAQNKPLSLSASIGFEQSYETIDGDSASAAELIVLLSSLSGVPVKQGLAITGSVNQKGQIQPIGGVNEKVEGFYDVCKAKGMTGEQGVAIPYQNVKNLMLKKEVVDAVKRGKFHIYPVETIDQAIEVMTGKEAGTRGASGKFRRGSINYLVDKRLREYAEDYRKFGKQQQAHKRTDNSNEK